MKVGIICAQGLEECEALIVYDMLFRAKIDVKLVGFDKTIISSHNLTFIPHLTLDEFDYENYDCLVLPGGMPGTVNLEDNQKVQEIIDYFVKENKYVATICAAPSILIHKGLLKDNKFICFPGHENGLIPANVKAITDGKFITGKGMGAAIEFSYEIIKALESEEKAKEVLSKIQF